MKTTLQRNYNVITVANRNKHEYHNETIENMQPVPSSGKYTTSITRNSDNLSTSR